MTARWHCTSTQASATSGFRRCAALTWDEAVALLNAAPPGDRPIWATALYAGLRLGELRGLLVENLDFARCSIDVEWGWDPHDGRIQVKYEASIRRVPINDALLPMLREHLGERTEGIVFPSKRFRDKPFSPSGLQQRADLAWAQAGLERVTPHDFRHAFGTFAIDAGMPIRLVSDLMGHRSVEMTESLYRYRLPKNHEDALAAVNDYIAQMQSTGRPRVAQRRNATVERR